MLKNFFSIIIVSCFGLNAFGQSNLYDIQQVKEIRIYFEESNWDEILDSFYILGDKQRLTGNLSIDGHEYKDVGIRYKGYSSASTNRIKNPFNIKLDYVNSGQNHEGFDKIKLSNVIQDPSFVREALSYEIARKYMPASQANFANVYVNDVLLGLYTNVEAVNKDFLEKHYLYRKGSFFKGNPEKVDLNGANSNLSDAPGTDSTSYFKLYDIESDFGWADLLNFIDTLNNEKEHIEAVLNVDQALWMHAFNYSLINFDSYVGYAQNFYLYRDLSERFNPILWDMNMSFASFRLTDASSFFSGFEVDEAKSIDPLSHYSGFSVHPRPLMRNLFENERYRKMYMAHIRCIMDENIANGSYLKRVDAMHSLIDEHVKNDDNKFYSYNAFLKNRDTTISDLIEYPGIKDLMEGRYNYLKNYWGYQGAPTIENPNYENQNLNLGDSILITINAKHAEHVFFASRKDGYSPFVYEELLDDGKHNDGNANDGIYGIYLSKLANINQFYFYAENDSAGAFLPKRAAHEFFQISIDIEPGVLVINELMASNETGKSDSEGEFEDWIELFNNSENAISTQGLYLTDDISQPHKWALPIESIQAFGYQTYWADNEESEGDHHCNFKLSKSGETVYLVNSDSLILDEISYQEQETDVSYGRHPNGIGSFDFLFPTYDYSNDEKGLYQELNEDQVLVFPNPTENYFNIEFETVGTSKVLVSNCMGQIIIQEELEADIQYKQIDLKDIQQGVYIVRLLNNGKTVSKKIIKL